MPDTAEIILQISKIDQETLHLDGFFHALHHYLSTFLDTRNFHIALYNKEKDQLAFAYYIDEIDVIKEYDQYYLENPGSSELLIAEVLRSGGPLLLQGHECLERTRLAGKSPQATPAQAWLGIPLKIKNEVVGILTFKSYTDPGLYAQQDMLLLASVSGAIAMAVRHKQMAEAYHKNEEIKQTLFRISNAVNTTQDLAELYRSIHKTLGRVIDLPNFYIALIERENRQLLFPYIVDEKDFPGVYQASQKIDEIEQSGLFSLTLMTIESQKPLLINKNKILKIAAEKGRTLIGSVPEIWLGIPLKVQGNVIGIICIQDYTNLFHFQKKDIEILTAVSDQIAVAIDRKRADQEAKRRALQAALLYEIGQKIGAHLEMEELLQTVVDNVQTAFGYTSVALVLAEPKSGALIISAFSGDTREGYLKGASLKYDQGMIGRAAFTGQTQISGDVDQNPYYLRIGEEKTRSELSVPLKRGQKTIGILDIQSDAYQAFSETDISAMETLSTQIASAIENARLYKEAQSRAERLAVINGIAHAAGSAPNLEKLMTAISEEISRIFRQDALFVAFYDQEKQELEFRFMTEDGIRLPVLCTPLRESLSSKVIRDQKALIIHDYTAESASLPRMFIFGNQKPSRTWIGVPLILESRIIGLVNIQAYRPHAWNEEDRELFFAIVDQITAVMERARLYEALEQELNERKKAEEEKKRLEVQLHQAQKMEAIGTLAGGIAHDFNNVLYPIIGYTEMTMDLVPEGSHARKNLDEILVAADRAKEMIRQILTFSRQQEIIPEPICIQPIVKEALKLLRSSIPTTIEIIHDIDDQCGPVLITASQVHQILMNLCTNAYHAMRKQGGILTVSLAEMEINPGSQSGVALEPGAYLCLTVRDTGHGIDPFILNRIFDPYFTTKPVGEGTGMGLALVHGIVKGYGGEINVSSRPGEGSSFQIFLRRVLGHASEMSTKTPVYMTGNGERILIIDDEEQIAEMLRLMVESLGYRVTAKTSSLQALEEFRARPEQYDVVITDQTMPGIPGFDLARKMLALRPDLPIILCTGYSDLVDETQTKAIGIRKFIAKPILKHKLAQYIREALDKNLPGLKAQDKQSRLGRARPSPGPGD